MMVPQKNITTPCIQSIGKVAYSFSAASNLRMNTKMTTGTHTIIPNDNSESTGSPAEYIEAKNITDRYRPNIKPSSAPRR